MCDEQGCDLNEERRIFLKGTGASLLAFVVAGSARASQTQSPPTRVLDNKTIQHDKVTFKSGTKEIDGYLARPKAAGKYRSVLVIAGNRITEEYIPNTCAALAVAGYVGLAPNIFHTVPDTAQTPDQISKAREGRAEDQYLDDIRAGADYLKTQKFVRSGTGIWASVQVAGEQCSIRIVSEMQRLSFPIIPAARSQTRSLTLRRRCKFTAAQQTVIFR
jgi:Dienelactone hydrolase family